MFNTLALEFLIPVAISLLALVISGVSLGWNIYSAMQRPKFRVSVAKKRIFQIGADPSPPFISVEALNLGPSSGRIGLVFLQKSWWSRRIKRLETSSAFLAADYSHPATSPQSVLAAQIEVGDSAAHAFPYELNSFLKEDWVRVGFADSFGRLHWASKKELKSLRSQYLTDFDHLKEES